MSKKFTLTLTEEQAAIVSNACEFYARVRMGQFGEISHCLMVQQPFDETWIERRDAAETYLYLARKAIYPELDGRGHSYGIGKFKDADLAFDVHQVLRMEFGDKRPPFSEYPLPACQVENAPDPVSVRAEKTGINAAKLMAQKLNGRQYGVELTKAEAKEAKDAGLVVVFGYSDDNIELRGAIDDELGCFNGGMFMVTRAGGVRPVYRKPSVRVEGECLLEARWCAPGSGCSWTYETNIPHESFEILDDGDLYCVGIVFDIQDII